MSGRCSDELLVRARRNSLSAPERARLDAHLAYCEACAAELRCGKACDRALGERTGDDLLAMRMATQVLRRWSPRSKRSRRTRAVWLACAAAVMAMASVGYAAFRDKLSRVSWAPVVHARTAPATVAKVDSVPLPIGARPVGSPDPLSRTVPSPLDSDRATTPVVPSVPSGHEDARTSDSVGGTTPMGPRAGTRPSPVDSIPPNVNALGVSRDVNAQSTPAPTPLDISGATPDQLFVRASDARHRGDLRAAVTLYRTLERQYPEARQATLCRVLLGRILLMEEIGDPAGALAEFDAYLASSPDGTLVEEALEGRGRALERLGRANDADDAWRTLLRRFPSSIYGARARQRLGEP